MSDIDSLNNLLEFVSFTHEVRKVKRSMWVKDDEQFENDSEHGYQLALVSLYIIEENRLELDAYRCMGMAIVHDILEVHAGDISVFAEDQLKSTKPKKEREAVLLLKKQWPQMKLMLSLIEEYENKLTAESKFVYALDKLAPMLNNYLDNGRNWHKDHIVLNDIVEVKKGKVDIDPVISKYYADMVNILQGKPELFG